MSVYGCLAAGSGHAARCHDANTTVKFACTVSFKRARTCRTFRTRTWDTKPPTATGTPSGAVKLTQLRVSSTQLHPLPASEPLFHRLLPALVQKISRVRCAGRWTVTGAGGGPGLSRAVPRVGCCCEYDVLPNNNTAAMARLVPLLFVQKCHGSAGGGHVTVGGGGRRQKLHEYEQRWCLSQNITTPLMCKPRETSPVNYRWLDRKYWVVCVCWRKHEGNFNAHTDCKCAYWCKVALQAGV